MLKTIIQIETNQNYIAVLMGSESEIDVKSLNHKFCLLNNLSDFSGLPKNDILKMTEKYINFLKDEGFKSVNLNMVCFSDEIPVLW